MKQEYYHSTEHAWDSAIAGWLGFACMAVVALALFGCTSSIHNQARTITYIALSIAEADEDDALKVQAIAGVGLSMVAEGEEADHISQTLLNLVKTQFSGRRAGLIEIMYLDVSDMVQASIDIPEAYRAALAQAFAGVIQGAEFYIQDIEPDDVSIGAGDELGRALFETLI